MISKRGYVSIVQWVSLVLRPPRRTVYSTQHALRLADRQYSADTVRMTDRHLFTAAEGKHAEGTRKNCAVAMPAGRMTNETNCTIWRLLYHMWDGRSITKQDFVLELVRSSLSASPLCSVSTLLLLLRTRLCNTLAFNHGNTNARNSTVHEGKKMHTKTSE